MVIPNALNAAMGAMHITKIKNFLNHKDKDFLRNILGRYDRDNNNQLDLKEVRAILRELNEGEEVEDELVHWVMEQADRDRSGMIGRHEVRLHTPYLFIHTHSAPTYMYSRIYIQNDIQVLSPPHASYRRSSP